MGESKTEQRRVAAAAYGGPGWSPRTRSQREELGELWHACGVEDETSPLKEVLLHRPGAELEASADPDAVQMLEPLAVGRAQAEHEALVDAYREAGVSVCLVDPPGAHPPPNLMFCADLFFMTPEGAVLGRPASTVRAGEERLVARRLAELGVPILRSLSGTAVFEGADAAWAAPDLVLLARGLRTNEEGARQVTRLLEDLGVEAAVVDLPAAAMHLMGALRFPAPSLAVLWPGRAPREAAAILEGRGFRVLALPEAPARRAARAMNFVTLGPGSILMPAGEPWARRFYEFNGIECTEVDVSELSKAAGAVACLTGVLRRES